ncbi:hypothetical protein GCM10010497_34340 [Streptomyces cinereoruber]|uniref:Secreted protein n=1 Tax=Streptomyces cinereoruber TaxID=67260 RepID=A0AAV4KL62_9ACTN|nr:MULTISPECIES: hypothetical protein [Streptomyces]MBB4159254.1 hypothetical protein [Streptomyces cinereoruber]NIH64286.1 hypothetical protein [Streptomyces cinereoruber]GGR29147.1 hypothetical protein GCM10010497_34340 [Streptomyces cinereoruber]
MDLGSVIIAVAGVAGTLGGTFLTQRASERARRREIALLRDQEEGRENLLLRRTCYVEFNRAARQFTTALNKHLHVMRERAVEESDVEALEQAKADHRDRHSEAQMIAPDAVLARMSRVNRALSGVYGQVKRLERGAPEPGETTATAARDQAEIWNLLQAMRAAMRHDLGVTPEAPRPIAAPEPTAAPRPVETPEPIAAPARIPAAEPIAAAEPDGRPERRL